MLIHSRSSEKSAGPCLPGAIRLRRVASSHRIGITGQRFSYINDIIKSQVRQTGLVGSRAPWNPDLPSSTRIPSNLGVSGETLKLMEISITFQNIPKSPKLLPETPKSHQNGVKTGTWTHQKTEKLEKVKCCENTIIYYTLERLGHRKSADF